MDDSFQRSRKNVSSSSKDKKYELKAGHVIQFHDSSTNSLKIAKIIQVYSNKERKRFKNPFKLSSKHILYDNAFITVIKPYKTPSMISISDFSFVESIIEEDHTMTNEVNNRYDKMLNKIKKAGNKYNITDLQNNGNTSLNELDKDSDDSSSIEILSSSSSSDTDDDEDIASQQDDSISFSENSQSISQITFKKPGDFIWCRLKNTTSTTPFIYRFFLPVLILDWDDQEKNYIVHHFASKNGTSLLRYMSLEKDWDMKYFKNKEQFQKFKQELKDNLQENQDILNYIKKHRHFLNKRVSKASKLRRRQRVNRFDYLEYYALLKEKELKRLASKNNEIYENENSDSIVDDDDDDNIKEKVTNGFNISSSSEDEIEDADDVKLDINDPITDTSDSDNHLLKQHKRLSKTSNNKRKKKLNNIKTSSRKKKKKVKR